MHRRRTRPLVLLFLAGVLVAAAAWGLLGSHPDGAEQRSGATGRASGAFRPPAGLDRSSPGPTDAFDTAAHSTTDPTSIWVIVNKAHPITPRAFRPEIAIVRGYQVAQPAAAPLTRLLDDSDTHSLGLKVASAFRSYAYQRSVHAQVAAVQGEAAADQVSARAGYSEHQTGLAVDIITPSDPRCDLDQCFAGIAGGRWLASNAWRYGFVVRYTAANQQHTGYSPEPWHLRYVGRSLAAELRSTGTGSLEEFFGITS